MTNEKTIKLNKLELDNLDTLLNRELDDTDSHNSEYICFLKSLLKQIE